MSTVLDALFPATRKALLVGFFRQPERRYYLREIRLVGKGQGSVQRELANLVEAGILARVDEHGRGFFSANPHSPVFHEMRGLIEKTAGATSVLAEALKPLSGDIDLTLVFGSVARGDAGANSDLDLSVVGQASLRSIVSALVRAERRLGREINPVVHTPGELRQRYRRGDPFVLELVRGAKQFVVGREADLESLLGLASQHGNAPFKKTAPRARSRD